MLRSTSKALRIIHVAERRSDHLFEEFLLSFHDEVDARYFFFNEDDWNIYWGGESRSSCRASQVLLDAAENDDAIAQELIAGIYMGSSIDYTETYFGDDCYCSGRASDYEEALKWAIRAAENGRKESNYTIGFLYYHGKGVPRDIHEALKWLEVAATYNICGAIFLLGKIYFEGNGVDRDMLKAEQLLRDVVSSKDVCYSRDRDDAKNMLDVIKSLNDKRS